MLDFLPGPVKGILSLSFYVINTIVICLILFLLAFVKFVVPIPSVLSWCNRMLIAVSSCWISINSFNTDLFNRIQWDVRGVEALELHGWYLVISNHQSWVDILVLQKVLNKKIPFLKFFLKKELVWVPFLGLAWWALDFPFMRRYSREFLENNPHLRGKDLESTKKACERFKSAPVSIMNFVEGTRFTRKKQQAQGEQFKNLLLPRAGGIAFVMGTMGDFLLQVINVTIVYPGKRPTFWEFISGDVKRIIMDVEILPVTQELKGDYFNNRDYRACFCTWLNDLWEKKDIKIDQLLKS